MSPVGATNVGSIRVFHDPDLVTNVKSLSANESKSPFLVHFNDSNTQPSVISTSAQPSLNNLTLNKGDPSIN